MLVKKMARSRFDDVRKATLDAIVEAKIAADRDEKQRILYETDHMDLKRIQMAVEYLEYALDALDY